jgi:hypothetical protein
MLFIEINQNFGEQTTLLAPFIFVIAVTWIVLVIYSYKKYGLKMTLVYFLPIIIEIQIKRYTPKYKSNRNLKRVITSDVDTSCWGIVSFFGRKIRIAVATTPAMPIGRNRNIFSIINCTIVLSIRL